MAQDPNIGRVLDGKYELVRLIGTGGMGGVYEAQHHLIGRRMAVKLLHAEYARDENVVQRFKREATSTSAVGHENIVEITDMGVTDTGELFLVMEYLDGRDLASVIEEVGRGSQGWSCFIVAQVLSALEATHAAGIVHRDLKPANVFLAARPETESFVKIVDFGISKVRADEQGVTQGLTRTGELLGTPQYMSTEQARGDTGIGAPTDIYSAGVILYETLTGQQPYTGKTYTDILLKILTEEPPDPAMLRPDLAPGLLAAIRRAMMRDPAERFASASAFLEAIRPYVDPSAPIAAGPVESVPPAAADTPRPSRHPSSTPPPGTPGSGVRLATTPLELSADATVPPPARKRVSIPVLAGVVGLAVVVALAVWFVLFRNAEIAPPVVPLIPPSADVRGGDSTESASAEASAGSSMSTVEPPAFAEAKGGSPTESASAEASAGSSSSKSKLTVQVTPPKALILLDGVEIGRGSGSWELPADRAQHTIEVSAKGWNPVSRTVSLDKDLTVVFDLARTGKGKGKSSIEGETAGGSPTEPASAEAKGGSPAESASAEASAGSSKDEPELVLVPKQPAEPSPEPAAKGGSPAESASAEATAGSSKTKPEKEEPPEKKFKREIDEDIPW